jgi:DNA-binding SARP family transcriptional activator
MLAVAATTARLPEADLELRRAEALARAAGVPGARVAVAAAAVLASDGQLGPVHTDAEDVGLPPGAVTAFAGRPRRQPAVERVAAAEAVRVVCFGGFTFSLSGQPVDWSALRPRARAAMRLLALNADRPVHRDMIIDALFPNLAPAAATRNLHVTLSSLRNFLDARIPPDRPPLLRRDGDAYLLVVPVDGYVDICAFRTAIEAAHRARIRGDEPARLAALRTAVETYGGDLLPEDGPAEWVVRARDELRHDAANAAADLAAAELAAGDGPAAVAAARRCITIDMYHDAGWRALIAAYRFDGDLAAAERARREYADVLDSLGVSLASAVNHEQRTPALRRP